MEKIYDKDDRKISQEQLEEKSDNIYETIMVLGKRIRQIEKANNEEFEKLRNELMDERSESEYTRDYFSDSAEEDLPVFPKAIRVSIDEMLNDKLEFEYEAMKDIE
ncbi:MAG: DNA-directed RNA polymerase subunit omega [Candidatus Delongbacteria bacterium]|nr:DNA-directed RNA polymerase subunit omega [Candidatus Delongbacteria bacterium]